MEVIKESEITELAVPWANSRLSWLMRNVHAKMSQLQVKDVANKPIAPLSVDEVVRVTSKMPGTALRPQGYTRSCRPRSTGL